MGELAITKPVKGVVIVVIFSRPFKLVSAVESIVTDPIVVILLLRPLILVNKGRSLNEISPRRVRLFNPILVKSGLCSTRRKPPIETRLEKPDRSVTDVLVI